jgi:hypothetical protein
LTSLETASRIEAFIKKVDRLPIWRILDGWRKFYEEYSPQFGHALVDHDVNSRENANIRKEIQNFIPKLKEPALTEITDPMTELREALQAYFPQAEGDPNSPAAPGFSARRKLLSDYDYFLKNPNAKAAAVLVTSGYQLETWWKSVHAILLHIKEELALPKPAAEREEFILFYKDQLDLAQIANILRAFYEFHNLLCGLLGIVDEVGSVKIESGSLLIYAYLVDKLSKCMSSILGSPVLNDFTQRGQIEVLQHKAEVVKLVFDVALEHGAVIQQETKDEIGNELAQSALELAKHRPRFAIDQVVPRSKLADLPAAQAKPALPAPQQS